MPSNYKENTCKCKESTIKDLMLLDLLAYFELNPIEDERKKEDLWENYYKTNGGIFQE